MAALSPENLGSGKRMEEGVSGRVAAFWRSKRLAETPPAKRIEVVSG